MKNARVTMTDIVERLLDPRLKAYMGLRSIAAAEIEKLREENAALQRDLNQWREAAVTRGLYIIESEAEIAAKVGGLRAAVVQLGGSFGDAETVPTSSAPTPAAEDASHE